MQLKEVNEYGVELKIVARKIDDEKTIVRVHSIDAYFVVRNIYTGEEIGRGSVFVNGSDINNLMYKVCNAVDNIIKIEERIRETAKEAAEKTSIALTQAGYRILNLEYSTKYLDV